MTIFWCYKFWKDEDLCVVDYKSFVNSPDVDHPVLSFCFHEPVIELKLKNYNTTFTSKKYYEFLYGEEYYDGMENVDFDNVTIDLTYFYLSDSITFKNGTYIEGRYPNIVNQLPELTYSGFYYGSLIKCYGLEMRDKQIKEGYFRFNSSMFPNGIRPNDLHQKGTGIVATLHLPNQASLSGEKLKYVWPKRTVKKEYTMDFIFKQAQVLKRRNKRTEACLSDIVNYDKHLLNSHLETKDCRAPYQKTERNLPICSSKENMKQTVIDLGGTMGNQDFLTTPCTSMKDIRYTFYEQDVDWDGSDWFWISITLPDTFMEIVQVRAVDVQTVIGNAGGYVGLFVGK